MSQREKKYYTYQRADPNFKFHRLLIEHGKYSTQQSCICVIA